MANRNPFEFYVDNPLRFAQSSYELSDFPSNTDTYEVGPGGHKPCCSNSILNRISRTKHDYFSLPPYNPINELSNPTSSNIQGNCQSHLTLPLGFNQQSAPPPSQQYFYHFPVGLPQHLPAPGNICNAQNFSPALPQWLSAEAAPNSLQHIYVDNANFSCDQPSPLGLGYDGNGVALALEGPYLPASHNVHQIFEDSTSLYGSYDAFNFPVDSIPFANAIETDIASLYPVPDTFNEASQIATTSGNPPHRLSPPNSFFQPFDEAIAFDTFDPYPPNHGQFLQTPEAAQDPPDLATTYYNGCDNNVFSPRTAHDRITLPIRGVHTSKTATQSGGRMVALSHVGTQRNKVLKKTQQKQRKPFTNDEKLRIKAMRKQGACWSCRINKKKCDVNMPCRNCQNNATAKIFNQPCCRDAVTDVVPFRQGNSLMGKTESRLPKLRWPHDNTELKRVQLIYSYRIDDGYPRPVLPVECRRFIPDRDEVLKQEWQVDGQPKVVELPPYAWFDRYGDMKDVMSNFMDECKECMEQTMLDAATDELHKLTITEANRYSKNAEDNKGSQVGNALKIRAGAFLMASVFSIQGEENLGVQECRGATPSYFKYPLPPVLDYQVDTMGIEVMKGHLTAVLKHLKSLIAKGRPREVWYEAFLIIFVLLSTLEFVYQKQLDYVEWHQGTSQETGVSHVASSMMKEWEHSAANLITHFRFVLRAHTPFTETWEQTKDNGLDNDAAAYLSKVNKLVQSRKSEFEGLKSSENFRPFKWLSQLFLD